MQRVIIEKGVTEHRYESGTVRVHAPRDIKLEEWEAPLQVFLSAIEKRKAVRRSA